MMNKEYVYAFILLVLTSCALGVYCVMNTDKKIDAFFFVYDKPAYFCLAIVYFILVLGFSFNIQFLLSNFVSKRQ